MQITRFEYNLNKLLFECDIIKFQGKFSPFVSTKLFNNLIGIRNGRKLN